MTTIELTRKPRQEYTQEEIERCLTALALVNGNTRRASDELAKAGFRVPHQTLDKWTRSRRDDYLAVQKRVLPGLRAKLAQDNEALATQLLEVMHSNVEKLKEKVNDDDLTFKERSDAAYKLSLSQGIVVDKSLTLRGDPTAIVEHRSVDESLAGLKRLGMVWDSTATEVHDAESDPPPAPLRPSE